MGLNLIILGTAMFGASGLLFNIHLIQLRNFLRQNCPLIWAELTESMQTSNSFILYSRLRLLPFEYESDNTLVNNRLRNLVLISHSSYLGLAIVLLGVIVELI